jgi:YHS domain-containing protein
MLFFRWQNFRKDNNQNNRKSVAPTAPLKKADKLATGFASWGEEQAHEEKVRKEAGHASTGSGYTTFKKKDGAEEAAERKRIKQIEARIRPDDNDFFKASTTFQGWKFNYIFTTRPDRGTGYFWDGMDAIKELRGELKVDRKPAKSEETTGDESAKPKKKKRKKNQGPTIISDPNNPMEQVLALIQKRKQGLTGNIDQSLPVGWEKAQDPASGKQYYFCRATGERSWTKPDKAQSNSQSNESEGLPEGWNSATDAATGKVYYFNKNGETKWTKPSVP